MKGLLLSLMFTGLVNASELYKLSLDKLNGTKVPLSQYKDKVTLIVNTASKCGFTGQFGDLQKLYDKYKEQGFEIIGFPSNDFNQEALSNEKIGEFCQLNYGVKFTMASKVHVNGKKRHPVYQYLVKNSQDAGKDISWNFEKFLVDKKGAVIGRYRSNVNPLSSEITKKIETAIKEK